MLRKVRYAVVGLGHIAQTAVLPAFNKIKTNSKLVALVSGDEKKLRLLAEKYKIKHTFLYHQFEDCLAQGLVDAVYIATPNVFHSQYAELAAKHHVHVLTEKPMATTENECVSMLRAARVNKIKMMVGYRLHFDPAHLAAVTVVHKKQIGEARIFNSLFSFQLKGRNNIRLKKNLGGGPLYDIGIYCVNAARSIFEDEPTEVFAMKSANTDPRFREVEEMVAVILRYPKNRLASFCVSFGAEAYSTFDVLGTKGSLNLTPAYEYNQKMVLKVNVGDVEKTKTFAKRDHFVPEIRYFSDCILRDIEPKPSAEIGLLDVRLIEAIYESIETVRPVYLTSHRQSVRSKLRGKMPKPIVRKPEWMHTTSK